MFESGNLFSSSSIFASVPCKFFKTMEAQVCSCKVVSHQCIWDSGDSENLLENFFEPIPETHTLSGGLVSRRMTGTIERSVRRLRGIRNIWTQ